MKFSRYLCFWLWAAVFLGAGAAPAHAAGKLKIVATTSTFASLAESVAGERAEIYFIASPKQNIHYIEPTPKDVLKVKRADVFIHAGLDLELAWREPLLHAAANPLFLGGGKQAIDVSKGVVFKDVPASISRAAGDIHLYGNPHYWMDPENAKVIVRNIAEGLAAVRPEEADHYRENARRLTAEIDAKLAEWMTRLAPFKGEPVVTYHRNWIYFTERFGFAVVGELEPKPGIPPLPKHLAGLEKTMREKSVKVIFRESYEESRSTRKLAEETGAKVLWLVQSVGEYKEIGDYISMMEYNVRTLENALGAAR
ncbi:MAG: zinc ABC transporter substrate-binding protein [Candidatus Omnitrophica bacterium]|nr:zinc ABC transporter substrate-binding protein [Candidatus Omnitrophota bacterium]